MNNENFLDFDEAVMFLKTTPSTLYKWLQSGKIKGHKLGRQWRFVKVELERYLNGECHNDVNHNDELTALVKYFQKNKITNKSQFVDFSESDSYDVQKVFEALIADIQHENVWSSIHFKPKSCMYGVFYRQGKELKLLTEISFKLFDEFEKSVLEIGTKTKKHNQYRFKIYKNENDFYQVKAQILNTTIGNAMILDLFNQRNYVGGNMEKVITNKVHSKKISDWLEKKYGILFVTGEIGSGKSTTINAFENILSERNNAVYNISNEAFQYVDNISYVEYKAHDKEDFINEFSQIMNSDPDVITFTGSFVNIEDEVMRSIYEAARSGHFIIVQMDFGKISELQKYLNEKSKLLNLVDFNNLVVGIISQKLIQSGKGKIAETEIWENII